MENKIQQLTDKLYAEGLQRGVEESERLIAEATKQGDKIIAEAKAKAERIIADAQRRDEELAANTRKEMILAAAQMVADTKQTIREVLLKGSFDGEVKANFNDPTFIASLIEKLVTGYASGVVEVPAAMEQPINDYLKQKVSAQLLSGITLRPSVSAKEGFRLEQEGGRYYINFGKAEFDLFLSDYLRPKVSKLLFGEE